MSRYLLSVVASLLLLGGVASTHASPRVPEGAHAGGAIDEGNPRVEARLVIDASQARSGEAVRAGVLFELDRGWHIYWRNPGKAGLPTKLEWKTPGAAVGPIQWPAPEVFQEGDFLTTYGYGGEVLLWNELTFDTKVRGERSVRVKASFLACRVRCIPGSVELARPLLVDGQSRPADDETRELFERYASRVPVTAVSLDLDVTAIYSQSAVRPGDSFRAAVVVVPCAAGGEDRCGAYALGARQAVEGFVPDRIESIQLEVTGGRPHPFSPGGFLVTLAGQASDEDPGSAQRLRGVLSVRVPGVGVRPVLVDLPLPRVEAGNAVTPIENPWLEPLPDPRSSLSLLRALALALVGGLILNLMPCVLPVLALKVFGIAELAHKSRVEVLKSGLAYTAGILTTMLALGASVVALRSAGTAVGWGFQFQEPLFIGGISTVLMLFALNLFGVFEIGFDATRVSRIGEGTTGPSRSFFEGLLAVILATPCSAPFLGTAVGFAFASSTPVILAIFGAIGLGLAAPYLFVTWVPAWARLVPRPGMWMVHLRRGLGFALIGTLVWLIWITGRSVGIDGVAALLGFLVGIAFLAWIYGLLQSAQRPAAARGVGLLVLALCVGGLAGLPLEPTPAGPHSAAEGEIEWQAFDRAAITVELSRGRPVFVDFTADWCLTCKANESLVITSDRVQAELRRLDVAMFRADWTRRDEEIRAELARFGRAGVPMYLLYSPGNPGRPTILPELLTVDLVVDALRRLEVAAPAVRPKLDNPGEGGAA